VQADVQNQLDLYRIGALSMSAQALEDEPHKPSLLAQNMAAANDPRPVSGEHCHCHAMVSGAHAEAAEVRAMLAWCRMRIDAPRNGCWLPRNTKARAFMPEWLKSAVPHSRIHRKSYYAWLDRVINPIQIKSSDDLLKTLKMIRVRLQSGKVPQNILTEMGL